MGDKRALELRVDSNHPWYAGLAATADDANVAATLTIDGIKQEYHLTSIHDVASFASGVRVVKTEWEAAGEPHPLGG